MNVTHTSIADNTSRRRVPAFQRQEYRRISGVDIYQAKKRFMGGEKTKKNREELEVCFFCTWGHSYNMTQRTLKTNSGYIHWNIIIKFFVIAIATPEGEDEPMVDVPIRKKEAIHQSRRKDAPMVAYLSERKKKGSISKSVTANENTFIAEKKASVVKSIVFVIVLNKCDGIKPST